MIRQAPQIVYSIEIRNMSGVVKDLVQKEVSNIHWSDETLCGYSEAKIALKRPVDE